MIGLLFTTRFGYTVTTLYMNIVFLYFVGVAFFILFGDKIIDKDKHEVNEIEGDGYYFVVRLARHLTFTQPTNNHTQNAVLCFRGIIHWAWSHWYFDHWVKWRPHDSVHSTASSVNSRPDHSSKGFPLCL